MEVRSVVESEHKLHHVITSLHHHVITSSRHHVITSSSPPIKCKSKIIHEFVTCTLLCQALLQTHRLNVLRRFLIVRASFCRSLHFQLTQCSAVTTVKMVITSSRDSRQKIVRSSSVWLLVCFTSKEKTPLRTIRLCAMQVESKVNC